MEYFQQEKDYTCGCAAVRMVISHFRKEIPGESLLEGILGTNDRIGTKPENIISYLQDQGFEVKHGEGGDLAELDKLMSDGYMIILKISVDVPHTVVIHAINSTHVFFYDPCFGKISRDKKKFISPKQNFPHYRWKIIASEFKKAFPEYDFTEVESNRGWIAVKDKICNQ